VTYATANETALAGQDYTATAGTLTIPPNSASATIPVPILINLTTELAETFSVTLSLAMPHDGAVGMPSGLRVSERDECRRESKPALRRALAVR
jgi:hypothetical protein